MCRLVYCHVPHYKRPHFIRFDTVSDRVIGWHKFHRRYFLTSDVINWCNVHGGNWIFHQRAGEIAFEDASQAFHFKMRWAGC